MEDNSGYVEDDDRIELPPGFRFHPTDEELICQYLYPKVLNGDFSAQAVGEVNLNQCEPWELPWKAKMGEVEWYFFCLMDRKYPTGQRTNRATPDGYWKATGKDKEIYKGKALVGMKKTLVFYKGRAPKGEKTNWVMHEYKLEGIYSACNLPETAENGWIICRIFNKTSGGKKIHISELMSSNPDRNESSHVLPPLMDSPSNLSETITTTVQDTSHSNVTCFSSAMEDIKMQHDAMIDGFILSPTSNPLDAFHGSSIFGKHCPADLSYSMRAANMQYPESVPSQKDQSIYGMLVDNNLPMMKRNMKAEMAHDGGLTAQNCLPSFGGEGLSASAGAEDFNFLWNY